MGEINSRVKRLDHATQQNAEMVVGVISEVDKPCFATETLGERLAQFNHDTQPHGNGQKNGEDRLAT
ncbi:MAG: hypothetical protein CSA70_08740 [Rhodobacterales bacterium]|nr:MAG: hypothetical protein CSA70_08740 [Rhodobacterales bacterium]